ncbi:hypothetical protein ACMA5I_10230 [Paracoccaceae bacterium GXU_MW_L88]
MYSNKKYKNMSTQHTDGYWEAQQTMVADAKAYLDTLDIFDINTVSFYDVVEALQLQNIAERTEVAICNIITEAKEEADVQLDYQYEVAQSGYGTY